MRDTWVIAKREFLERVRSKWFVVMTVLWPLLMVGMIVAPALLGGQGTDGAKVVLVDRTGTFERVCEYTETRSPRYSSCVRLLSNHPPLPRIG